jgi:hypothetical protein
MCRVPRNVTPAALLLTAVMLGIGCTSNSVESHPTGKARVSFASSALILSDIKSVTITVGPGTGTPTFPNIVQAASQGASGNWTAFVDAIPAGVGRTFHVEACDVVGACDSTIPAANHLYAGDAVATIVAGSVPAQVYLLLQQLSAPNGFNNHAPVIDSLTASASQVVPGGAVTLGITAHDPDTATDPTNHLSGYLWTATCGTLTGATTQTPTWTAPSPSPDTTCTINVTVSDVCGTGQPVACNSSVTASLQVQVSTGTNGSANISAYANTCPMLSCVAGAEKFTYDTAGAVNGYEADLTVTAADTDGDELHYVWSSVPCPGAIFTPTGANPTSPIIDTGVASRTVHFKANTTVACDVRVDVTDYWPNSTPPAGSGLPAARGCDNVGILSLSGASNFHIAPVITRIATPNAGNQVAPGQPYTFGASVADNNVDNAYPLKIDWYNDGASGTFGNQIPGSPFQLSAPGNVSIVWNSPATLVPGMAIRLRVTNAFGLYTEHVFNIVPANQCALASSLGQACASGNACLSGTTCQANGTCGGGTATTCAAPAACHLAGVCNPGTGACDYAVAPVATACNADTNGCTVADACNATGTCVAGPPPACNTPATACYAATGTCAPVANDPIAFSCNYSALTSGTTCSPTATQDHCFASFACDGAGTCAGSAAISCAGGACSSGGTCNPATGACVGGTNLPPGSACTGTDPCQNYACNGTGACTGTSKCAAGQSCTPAVGVCVDTAPIIATVRNNAPTGTNTAGLSTVTVNGLVYDSTGAAYLFGHSTATIFDGVTITNAGSTDLLIAKYASSGAPTWVQTYGDAATQTATGLAVTSDGTVAALGQFLGTVGGKTNPRTYAIDVLAAVLATNGTAKWTKMFDSGIAGALKAVAANPALNVIAVCGYVDGTQAAAGTDAPIVPATEFAGGTRDAAIAVYNTATGAEIWHRDLVGAAAEECDALTVDAAGNVYAAGKYTGALDFGAGGTPVDASTAALGKLWVAKFAAATGATLADASFGVSGNTVPTSLALDSTGKLIVGGSFTAPAASPLVFGSTSLGSAGATDAFVAKLDPAAATAFTPVWAVRLGGGTSDVANSVAIGQFDAVLVVGSHSGNALTTGAAALSAGGANPNGFMLKLAGSSGVATFAATYGDTAAQSCTTVATYGATFALGGSTPAASTTNFGGSTLPAVAYGAPTLVTTGPASFLNFGTVQ